MFVRCGHFILGVQGLWRFVRTITQSKDIHKIFGIVHVLSVGKPFLCTLFRTARRVKPSHGKSGSRTRENADMTLQQSASAPSHIDGLHGSIGDYGNLRGRKSGVRTDLTDWLPNYGNYWSSQSFVHS